MVSNPDPEQDQQEEDQQEEDQPLIEIPRKGIFLYSVFALESLSEFLPMALSKHVYKYAELDEDLKEEEVKTLFQLCHDRAPAKKGNYERYPWLTTLDELMNRAADYPARFPFWCLVSPSRSIPNSALTFVIDGSLEFGAHRELIRLLHRKFTLETIVFRGRCGYEQPEEMCPTVQQIVNVLNDAPSLRHDPNCRSKVKSFHWPKYTKDAKVLKEFTGSYIKAVFARLIKERLINLTLPIITQEISDFLQDFENLQSFQCHWEFKETRWKKTVSHWYHFDFQCSSPKQLSGVDLYGWIKDLFENTKLQNILPHHSAVNGEPIQCTIQKISP